MTMREKLQMLRESGFVACYVRDLQSGDVIMIEHAVNAYELTEMTIVGPIHTASESGLCDWIGELPDGLRVHCYGIAPGRPAHRRSTEPA